MQPTMKLRILRKEVYNPAAAMSGHAPLVFRDTWQQWWEQPVSIPIDGVVTEQVVGEWRDVPIEVEA